VCKVLIRPSNRDSTEGYSETNVRCGQAMCEGGKCPVSKVYDGEMQKYEV
jgi:hypothetical protein